MPLMEVDKLSAPAVVGEWYLVPSIHYFWFFNDRKRYWYPVIGPKHDDVEDINFKDVHYHVDARFLSKSTWDKIEKYYPDRGAEYGVAARPMCHWDYPELPVPVYRRMLCKRQVQYMGKFAFSPPWLGKLETRFSDRRLAGDRRVCPHRGAPLAGTCPDASGIVTCPLHGLRWYADTGLPAFDKHA